MREEVEKKETKKYQNRAAQAREVIKEAKPRMKIYPARVSVLSLYLLNPAAKVGALLSAG